MNQRIKGTILVMMLFLSQGALGQNEFFFNHYMFNPSYYNPAWIGVERQAFAAAHHRTQWAGYDATFDPGGAPSTQLLSVVIPVQGKFSGFGFSVVNDQVANLNSVQARLAISAKQSFNFGDIYIGLMPSINAQSLSANFRATDPGDALIPTGNESQLQPNLHAGIFFKSRSDYFIGVSSENILEPAFDFGTNAENKIERSYLLMGGYEFVVTRNITIKPTVLIRSDLKALSYEFSGIVTYQEKMWVGGSFRRAEAISLLLGYSFLQDNKLKAGYSFDYVIKDRDAKQPTSHEIFLRYDLPNLVFGGKKAVKTPRFTF